KKKRTLLSHPDSPAGGAKPPASRCTWSTQVVPSQPSLLADWWTLALGRNRHDHRPADVHSEKVPVPDAVERADGCGCRLCGKLWGDKSGIAEMQQPLALPGDRATSQRQRHRRRSGHKHAQRDNSLRAQGKDSVCKPRNQASGKPAFGTWILDFNLRD
uniref:Uncharacterized protein n=1 Tax=Marmota marmota marmota TaxID=9994 RepID=A0A8C5Z7S2_MARMA